MEPYVILLALSFIVMSCLLFFGKAVKIEIKHTYTQPEDAHKTEPLRELTKEELKELEDAREDAKNMSDTIVSHIRSFLTGEDIDDGKSDSTS